MSLAALYNVPKTAQGVAEFAFNNRMSHLTINQAIQAAGGGVIALPVLDPIPLDDIQNWAQQHQILHDAMNSVLGLEGNDLTDVDWHNLQQVEAWIRLHAQEHFRASEKLGVA